MATQTMNGPGASTTMPALVAVDRDVPRKLQLRTITTPVPAADEVLVEVHAAAITFAELSWELTWSRSPVVPSHELSGVVVATGDTVTEWSPGDEVFALVRFDRQGAAAGYCAVPAADVVRVPAGVPHVVASAIPLSALTAWQALVDHAGVRRGEDVLVHGGAGAVGSFAIQLAARFGARVTATARGADAELIRSLGADTVIDFERDRFDTVHHRYDVVIDTVAGDTLDRSYAVLRPGGRLITLSGPPEQARAAAYGVDAKFFVVTPDHEALEGLGRLVASGDLRVLISATFSLADGAAAYASGAESGRAPGKTVLVVRED